MCVCEAVCVCVYVSDRFWNFFGIFFLEFFGIFWNFFLEFFLEFFGIFLEFFGMSFELVLAGKS